MLIAGLVFAGCQALVFGFYALLAVWLYRRERERLSLEISLIIQEWVTAPDDKTPSPLAAFMDNVAMLLAARLVQQVKAMLAGVESGAAKGEQLALFEAAAEQSPWLSLIAGMLPKRLRNALTKNPQMIGALSKLGGGNHGTPAEIAPRRHRE